MGIILSSHPDYVIFRYQFQDDSENFIIWDLQSNNEVSSFFSQKYDQFKGFIHGDIEAIEQDYLKEEIYKKSKIGYLMFQNFYVNLETCVPCPTIKLLDDEIKEEDYDTGMKMSNDERFVLADGKLITSFSYLDIEFKSKRDELTTTHSDVFKYFIDRESVFNDYVQDPDKLEELIKLFSDEPLYYTLILTPNKQKKSPLDISIENNSLRVVKLFLEALGNIADYNLSKAFYKKFDRLFEYDIDVFRDFIDKCYIQSGQMRKMHKLPIKLDNFSLSNHFSKKLQISGDESIFAKTSCSIMDENFNKDFELKKKLKLKEIEEENEDESDTKW